MTGGAGFARQGQDSFRYNSGLRNRRTPLKDNPYAASNLAEGTRDTAAARETQAWMAQKKQRAQRQLLYVRGLIALAGLLAILLNIL